MNCHRLIEAYYGVLEAGAILLPLNIRLAPHELAFILRDAGVKVLFVGKEFVELANAFRKDAPGIEKFVLLEAYACRPIGLSGRITMSFWLGRRPFAPTSCRWTKILLRNFSTRAGRARIRRA